MMIRILFCLAICFLNWTMILAADPPATTPPKAAAKEAAPAGGTSPKEAFEQLRKAVIANDWTTALAQFDEPSQQSLIAHFAAIPMSGFLGEKGKVTTLTHLTDENKFKTRMAEIKNLPRKERKEAARSLAPLVKDPGGLMGKLSADFRGGKNGRFDIWLFEIDKSTLEIKSEEKESAIGSIRCEFSPGSVTGDTMNFRKINGRWFLNYGG